MAKTQVWSRVYGEADRFVRGVDSFEITGKAHGDSPKVRLVMRSGSVRVGKLVEAPLDNGGNIMIVVLDLESERKPKPPDMGENAEVRARLLDE